MTHLAEKPTNVADALQAEIKRVRDEIIPMYQSIGPAGGFAIAMMKADIDLAVKALAEGDVVEIIRQYAALKECGL